MGGLEGDNDLQRDLDGAGDVRSSSAATPAGANPDVPQVVAHLEALLAAGQAKPRPPGLLGGVEHAAVGFGGVAVAVTALATLVVAVVAILPGLTTPPPSREAMFTSVHVSPDTTLSDYSQHVSVAVAVHSENPRAIQLRPVAFRSELVADTGVTATTDTGPTPGTTAETTPSSDTSTEPSPQVGATAETLSTPGGPPGGILPPITTPVPGITVPAVANPVDKVGDAVKQGVHDLLTPTTVTGTGTSTSTSPIPPPHNPEVIVGNGATSATVANATTQAAGVVVTAGTSGGSETVALPPDCTSGRVARCGLTPEIPRGVSPEKAAHLLAALFADSRGLSCHHKFHPEGALLNFDLRLVGFYGQPVTVKWSLWPDGASHPLRRQWLDSVPAYRITPQASDASFAEPIWVPEPRASGRYHVMLVVTDHHGVERASASSKTFRLRPVTAAGARC